MNNPILHLLLCPVLFHSLPQHHLPYTSTYLSTCLSLSLSVYHCLPLCLSPSFPLCLSKLVSVSLSLKRESETQTKKEKVIFIQLGNSQCNHREYPINRESLQSIPRSVYSHTFPTLYFSLLVSLLARSLALSSPLPVSTLLWSASSSFLPLA